MGERAKVGGRRVQSMKILIVAMMLMLLVASSASADVIVTFSSSPEGATGTVVLAKFPRVMKTPFWVKYKTTRDWRTTCLSISASARWVSGAEDSSTYQVCKADGNKQKITFVRPSGFPGLEADVLYSKNTTVIVSQPSAWWGLLGLAGAIH
jgi:hypothetical protein